MNRRILITAAVLLAAGPAPSFAKDRAPNLVGTWRATTDTIVAGQGGNWVGNESSYAKPAHFERPFTVEIYGQDGRRFWGRSSIGGSPLAPEPFIGSLRVGGRQLVAANADGSFTGDLKRKNVLEYCYLAVPGVTNKAAIVGCSVLRRAR